MGPITTAEGWGFLPCETGLGTQIIRHDIGPRPSPGNRTSGFNIAFQNRIPTRQDWVANNIDLHAAAIIMFQLIPHRSDQHMADRSSSEVSSQQRVLMPDRACVQPEDRRPDLLFSDPCRPAALLVPPISWFGCQANRRSVTGAMRCRTVLWCGLVADLGCRRTRRPGGGAPSRRLSHPTGCCSHAKNQ